MSDDEADAVQQQVMCADSDSDSDADTERCDTVAPRMLMPQYDVIIVTADDHVRERFRCRKGGDGPELFVIGGELP